MPRKRSRWMLALACAACLLVWPALSAQTAGDREQTDTIFALLDRIDRIVANARKNVDTDDLEAISDDKRDGATVTVMIRAADLDEIRAEIAQIKLMLKPAAP